ncbi:MAG: hypothetical protein QXN15_04785 [Candidatus Jordarchaeales archaeon]|nr:hypothetical protein [Candidatus Jordarchaeia archaeon]
MELIKNEEGSPIVEEAILIGLSILGLAIMLNIMFGVFNWSGSIATNIINYLNNLFNGIF